MTHASPTRVRMSRSERRTQLLAAACEAFVENGYHATAMDDIADRAGVSKPVLYQHFPGKLELYLALLDHHAAQLQDLLTQALSSTTVNAERIAATVGAYFEFVDSDNGGYRLVFASDLLNEPEVRRRVDRVTTDCADAVATLIEEDTGLPPEECQLVGIALAGMAQTCAGHWVASGSPIPREAATTLVSSVAWRGLGGFPMVRPEGEATSGR